MSIGRGVSISVVLIIFVWHSASATNLTGSALLEQCSSSPSSIARKQCESYIAGLVDGIDTLTVSMKFLFPNVTGFHALWCIPRSTPVKDLVAATVDYLQNHSSVRQRQYGASSEVMLALMKGYPCRGDTSGHLSPDRHHA